ncbi:unnamed protein product [Brassica oleracea]
MQGIFQKLVLQEILRVEEVLWFYYCIDSCVKRTCMVSGVSLLPLMVKCLHRLFINIYV